MVYMISLYYLNSDLFLCDHFQYHQINDLHDENYL